MYYQNYEDYMRSVLGYPIETTNTYAAYSSNPYETMQMPYTNPARYSDEILDLYPEIYKIVNPMVCKICEANTKSITRELIDQMTDEIYMNLEVQSENETVVNVRANIPASKLDSDSKRNSSLDLKSDSLNMKSSRSSAQYSNTMNSTGQVSKEKQGKEMKEAIEVRDLEKETRQRRPDNRTLRDLIRILILNRLLGGFFPNRPPHRPPRPPMPPRPPVRPPFPREDRFYENYLR